MFEGCNWIWCNNSPLSDEYSEFYASFTANSGNTVLRISADSNYAVYINGSLAAFGQYADFPYDKVYDEIDLSDFVVLGLNHLAIIVWYYGIDTTQVYFPGKAAVKFEVLCEDRQVATSTQNTVSRMSLCYGNHRNKIITDQLGLSFFYDATKEDNWMSGELVGFDKSFEINQEFPLRKRPCKKLELQTKRMGKEIKRFSDTDLLFDLGTNEVGFLYIETDSKTEQTLTIAYGEHIADGKVRRIICDRDFSVEVKVKKGHTVYLNPFRRLGCKYLELFSESAVDVKIGIVPTVYPLTECKKPVLTKEENEIYDACIRTLRLCMHEHYEDCPWREQALYCMDSRNQMLLGYFAFNEYEFPRSNLQLISKDNRKDGLLSICFPIKKDLVIPSFSLHYFTECLEYYIYSNDITLLEEVYPKLCSIIKAFIDKMNIEGDLIMPFENDWNFYEWRKGLDGHDGYNRYIPDVLLNALLSIALQNMDKICNIIGKPTHYSKIAEKLNQNINKTFFDEEKGLYFDQDDTKRFSQLGNSLAILCGAASDTLAKEICEKLISDNSLTKISLSMQTFMFDALLKCDKEKYKDYILEDILIKYRPMIDYGVGTVWETELGESDFGYAGSLCHGWSAIPIYYYHILKN